MITDQKVMRLTIGKKLNGLVVTLQLLSITGVVVLAVQMFTSDLAGNLRKGTIDVSTMLSGRIRAEMKHVADRARMLGAASLESFKYDEDRLKFLQDNLAVDSTYIGMSLYRLSDHATDPTAPQTFEAQWRIVHPAITKKLEFTRADFDQLDQEFPLDFTSVSKGNVDFTIAKLKDGTPSLRMAIPFVQRADGTFSQLLAIELNQERLTSLFGESTAYLSYLVDRKGRVLGSTDARTLSLGTDVSKLAIIEGLRATKAQSGQQDYADLAGIQQMGAFQRVGFADLTVISEAPVETAVSAQKKVLRRTAFLAGAFLFLALTLSFFFSQSITGPIQALAGAAASVAQGDFTVRLPFKEKGGDEIQEFSGTFNHMVQGLQERDRVKATFAKFHSKEVADLLTSGEVNLGGERRSAVVFFSDVRGFTAMSEKMDPEALVKILNRYMTRMVRVIISHGGIVDKYVGDAIMALWGVPLPKEGDVENALRACIGMRQALAELNAELRNEGLPPLKIGMGLNVGPLIAGNIGSEERMEYTVIGDTVNTASRIESLTKEFGTDLLISQAILDQLPGKFITEKAHEAMVKGKSEPLVIHKVLGYIENGQEVRVETEWSSYDSEKSDKVVHQDKPADAKAKEIIELAVAQAEGLRTAAHAEADQLLKAVRAEIDAMERFHAIPVSSAAETKREVVAPAKEITPPPFTASNVPLAQDEGMTPGHLIQKFSTVGTELRSLSFGSDGDESAETLPEEPVYEFAQAWESPVTETLDRIAPVQAALMSLQLSYEDDEVRSPAAPIAVAAEVAGPEYEFAQDWESPISATLDRIAPVHSALLSLQLAFDDEVDEVTPNIAGTQVAELFYPQSTTDPKDIRFTSELQDLVPVGSDLADWEQDVEYEQDLFITRPIDFDLRLDLMIAAMPVAGSAPVAVTPVAVFAPVAVTPVAMPAPVAVSASIPASEPTPKPVTAFYDATAGEITLWEIVHATTPVAVNELPEGTTTVQEAVALSIQLDQPATPPAEEIKVIAPKAPKLEVAAASIQIKPPVAAPAKPTVAAVVTAPAKPTVAAVVTAPAKPTVAAVVTAPAKPTVAAVVTAPAKPTVAAVVTAPAKPTVAAVVTAPAKPTVAAVVTAPAKPTVAAVVTAPAKPTFAEAAVPAMPTVAAAAPPPSAQPRIAPTLPPLSRPAPAAISIMPKVAPPATPPKFVPPPTVSPLPAVAVREDLTITRSMTFEVKAPARKSWPAAQPMPTAIPPAAAMPPIPAAAMPPIPAAAMPPIPAAAMPPIPAAAMPPIPAAAMPPIPAAAMPSIPAVERPVAPGVRVIVRAVREKDSDKDILPLDEKGTPAFPTSRKKQDAA